MTYLHFAGTDSVQPIAIGPEYESRFTHLQGTPIFSMQPLLKMNRLFGKDKRICYVTDYTLNLAHPNGELSRCYKIEDIEELLVDPSRWAVGVRMRSRPFRRSMLASPRAYFEMPVDVVLFLAQPNAAAYNQLVDALCATHAHWTGAVLPVRALSRKEKFSDLLILVPDGSRVKPRAVRHVAGTQRGAPLTPSASPYASSWPSASSRQAVPPSVTPRAEEPSHAPHGAEDEDPHYGADPDERVEPDMRDEHDERDESAARADRELYSTKEVDDDDEVSELTQQLDAQESLYTARGAMHDQYRANASFAQLERLMWVYYRPLSREKTAHVRS